MDQSAQPVTSPDRPDGPNRSPRGLGEIKEILAFRDRGQAPCAHVTSLIEHRAADLSERIAALEAMRQDLERLAKRARRAPAEGHDGEFCHIIEAGTSRAG